MPLGFDFDAYNQQNPVIARPWETTTNNIERYGLGYQPQSQWNWTPNTASTPNNNMAGAALGQMGGAAIGGMFNFGSGVINSQKDMAMNKENREYDWKKTDFLNAWQTAQAQLNREFMLRQQSLGLNFQKDLQTADQGFQTDFRNSGISMQQRALESMGLPGGAWALSNPGGLPTTTQLISRGSYMRSRLPGNPLSGTANYSPMQQQMGWGNYTTRR